MVLFCIYTPLLMYKLHVKLNYQAFMLIHVVEQVQLFKWEQLILITSTSESGNVRGDKVAPMKPAILTWLVKVGGALAKKNVKNSRLEVMEKWRLLRLGMRDQLHVLFQSAVSFRWMHTQRFWIGLHAAEQKKCTQRNVKLCRHAPALSSDVHPNTYVYYLPGVGERA